MAGRGKVHKGLRQRKLEAMLGQKPENLVEPTRKMSHDELVLEQQRARAAGTMGKPARKNREREFTRRDRNGTW